MTNYVRNPKGISGWTNMDPRERMLAAVDVLENGCWFIKTAKTKTGYGFFSLNGQRMTAHRAAHIIWIGPIPDGYQVDHLCRNTSCVNPSHLEAVTRRTNWLRSDCITAKRARQTHCKHGHEFTPENTYVSKRGHRTCRRCHADDELRRKANLRLSMEMLEL